MRDIRTTDRRSAAALLLTLLAVLLAATTSAAWPAAASDDPERAWAHVVVATGYVDNVSVCTFAVCGAEDSTYRRIHEERGILLLDLDTMDLVQRPGPGWWFVGGTFVRDSFERNLTARADILSVHLSWSTGGLGTDVFGATFTVLIQPGDRRVDAGGSTSITLDPLEPGTAHTFTVQAQLPDGRTVTGPSVTATPLVDPDPDCTDRSVARECRAATSWAHISTSTWLVENVSVCTFAVCGAEDSDYRRQHAARGILLVELTDGGGIGWRYEDGRFIDVRPREEFPGIGGNGTADTGSTTPSDDTNDTNGAGGARTTDDRAASQDPDDPDTDGTSGDRSEPAVTPDDGPSVLEDETVVPFPAETEPSDTTGDEPSEGPAEDTSVAAAERPTEPSNPVQRVLRALVSFFSGLFGR